MFDHILGQVFAQNLGQVFDQVFGQGFDQVWGEGKNINAVYSTTRTEKYSVPYYPDGNIYYTVLFLKTRIYFVLWS